MKHIVILLVKILIGYFVLLGCSDTYNESSEYFPGTAKRYLNVSTSSLSFDAEPICSKQFTVETIGTTWAINNYCKWISLSTDRWNGKDAFSSIDVVATENESGDTLRSHIITVNSEEYDYNVTKPISIFQSVATPYINVEDTHISVPGRASTHIIPVRSNTNWYPVCDASFLSASRDNDNLILRFEANVTGRGRNATIQLVGSTTTPIIVSQEPSTITTTTDSLRFTEVAASYILSIESDLPWTAFTDYSWIQVTPESGGDSKSDITVSVTHNTTSQTREGCFYIAIEKKLFKIPVTQTGYRTEVSTNNIGFGSHGGVMQLTLSSNDNWNIKLAANNWVTSTNTTGNDNAVIELKALENASITPRSTSMYINTKYSGNLNVDITQNARFMYTSVQAVPFFGKGGDFDPIHLYTDAKYKIEYEGDWFSVSVNNEVIYINATYNNTGKFREGFIKIAATDLVEGELNVVIPVVQAIAGFTLSKENYKTDIDYNMLNSHGLSISITKYSSDSNYNESGVDGISKNPYDDRRDKKNGFFKDSYDNRKDIDDDSTKDIIKESYENENNYDE